MSRQKNPNPWQIFKKLALIFFQGIVAVFTNQSKRRKHNHYPQRSNPQIAQHNTQKILRIIRNFRLSRFSKIGRSLLTAIVTLIFTIAFSGINIWFTPPAYAAGLYIEPITWDFVGLDSNNVNVGPNNFLLAARVCNVSGSTLNNITIQYQRTGAFNPYITVTAINGINVDTISIPSLPSGSVPPNHQKIADSGNANMTPANCFDGYFNVVVTRDSNAYNTVQQYRIVATAAGAGSVDTNTALGNGTISGYNYGQTVQQQIYVEKLLSQSRNSVLGFSGPSTVYVGDTVEYTLTTQTATAYPQLTVSSDFPNGILQLVDVKTTYTSDSGAVSSGVYYDACGWLANPSDPGYHTSANVCAGPVADQDTNGDGKVGNTVTTRYRVKVLSTGNGIGSNTLQVNHLINDFSGGSYHYNSDYGSGLGQSLITVVDSTTDLQITKSHSGNFATGNNIYQLQVKNNGPNAARGTLRVVDTLPTGFSYVSASSTDPWTCSAVGQVVTCTNPNTSNFAVGATSTINLTVNVSTSAASYSLNTATVSSGSPDSNLANNTASDPTTVIKGTNLVLLKDDSAPDPTEQTFVAGSTATYLLTVKNTSGFDALGPLTIIDSLPTGLSYSSASGTGWTCTANGQNVTCTNPSGLASGDGTTTGISNLSLTVNVLSNVPTSVTNTASLTSGSLDTNPADNTNIQQTNPTTKPVPDLIINKTDNGQSFAVNQNGTYTITITNQGVAATSGLITITDTLPATFNFVSAVSASGSSGWTCTNTTPVLGATITCTNPNPLPTNNSSSILVTVSPTTVTGSPFTNTATVALPTGEETNTGNNTSSDTTPVAAAGGINLNVVKKLTQINGASFTPACTSSGQTDTCTATINPSNTIQYTIDITNNSSGSGDDSNITLTDIVPAEVTSVSWTCDYVDGAGVAGGNTGSPSPEKALGTGSSINACDPTNTAGTPKYRKTGTGNNISLGTISLRKSGGKVRFTIDGTIAASGFSGNFSNSATATPSAASGADSSIADNTYTVNAVIQGADLSITKTSFANFVQGQNGTYRLTVTNTGTPNRSTTDLITVTDVLPANLNYVSASSAAGSTGWSCSYTSGTRTVACSNPNILASGATSAIDVIVTPVVTGTSYSVTNNASVTTDGDTIASNNTASVTTSVIVPDPDVRITKTAGTLSLGQSGTYTLQVDNIGTTTAIAPIVVTDTLPTGLNYVSGTGTGWICSASGQTVTCTNYGNIAAGGSAPALTINVLVGTQTAASITNVASVAQVSGEPAGKLTNNSTSLVSSVAQAADLSIVKSHSGNFIQGQSASYQLLVTNNGPSSVPSTITVTDTLPNNLEFVSSTGGGFTCSAAAKVDGTPQVVTCTNTSGLVVGTSATITLNVLVRSTTPTGSITNTATVASAVSDPVSSNNSSSDPTTISSLQADLKLTKTHFGTFAIGGQGTYTLSVENLGPALATGTLTITDVLPNNLTFASAVGSPWTCSAAGSNPQTVTCTNPNTNGLAFGNITAVNVTVNIGTGTPVGTNSITNTASLNVPSYDSVSANNTASDPTTISGSADLSVTKTSTSLFVVGKQAVYTIKVTNNGANTSVAPITLVDQLPAGLTYASASGTNWTCPSSSTIADITCTYNVNLTSGTSTSDLTFTVNVVDLAPLVNPSTYTNFASVYGPTPDPNTANNVTQITTSPSVATVAGYKSVALTNDPDGSVTPSAGDTLTWRVSYANTGVVDVANFQIADVLDSDTAIARALAAGDITVNATQAAGTTPSPNTSYTGAGNNNLFASSFTLKAGGVVTVNIPINISATAVNGQVLQNQSTATSTDLPAAGVKTDNIDNTTTGLPTGVTPIASSLPQTQTATVDPTKFTIVSSIAATPKLLLAKRITAINDVPIAGFVNDGVASSADDDPNWPTPLSDYLRGAINYSNVKPSDRVEYSIYFLVSGNKGLTNITICDLVPSSTTFANGAYNTVGAGSNLDIAFANSATAAPTSPTNYLTGLFDSDRGQFYPANSNPPSTCKKVDGTAISPSDNTDGLVVVNVVSSPATLPHATSVGTPPNSYGFVRFQVKVK